MTNAITHSPSRRILFSVLTVALLWLTVFTTGCDSTDPEPDTSEGEVPYENIADFFAQRGANLQSFSISPNGGMITTDGGMEVMIPTAAFVNADGDTVRTDVDLSIREAFSIEDMINTNLTTIGMGDQPLITGGMFDIDATANGSSLALNRPITVNMPAETNTDPFTNQMTVWTADRETDTDTTTWTNTEQGVEAIRSDSTGNNRWFFQVTGLNWINCDVFWDADTRYDLTINQSGYTGEAENLNVYVVSSNPTGVFSALADGQGAYVRSSLAGGNTYTVVAIAVEDNVQYYGQLDVTLSSDQTVTVNLTPTSEADLDAALQAL